MARLHQHGDPISGFLGPIFIGWLIGATGSFEWAFVSMIVALVLAAGCLSLVRVPRPRTAAVNTAATALS